MCLWGGERGGTPQNFGVISVKSDSAQWHIVKPWEKYTRRNSVFFLSIALLSSVAFAQTIPVLLCDLFLQCYKGDNFT